MFMPITGTPRVEIRERRGESPIAGSDSISAALFIGPAPNGPGFYVEAPGDLPQRPVLVTSWDQYVRVFGRELPNGTSNPYLDSFFMTHAVRGFFDNGGKKAFILRLRTGAQKEWTVENAANAELFRIYADPEPSAALIVAPTPQSVPLRRNSMDVHDIDEARKVIIFDAPVEFFVGDTVVNVGGDEAQIVAIDPGNREIQLDNWIPVAASDPVRIANISPSTATPPEAIRIPFDDAALVDDFCQGAVVELDGRNLADDDSVKHWSLIQRIDKVSRAIYLVPDVPLAEAISSTQPATITAHSFSMTLTVDGADGPVTLSHLSPVSWSSRFVGTRLSDSFGTGVGKVPLRFVLEPKPLPALALSVVRSAAVVVPGTPDNPTTLNSAHFNTALTSLQDFDDAKLIVIADAARYPSGVAAIIRNHIKSHCDLMKDRFALLDADMGVHDAAALTTQVGGIRSDSGYVAFYYPWIKVPNPARPRDFMFVPPSGHAAGMYARVDNERGVHKSPANEKLFGALDVEARLGDRSQGPLHDAGVNVLRVFKGDAAVNVFGGRTTAGATKTDFRYINVRRLFLFIEDALKRSLREKLYEPNNQQLWKSLKRTIGEFLSRAQQSGAIFGTTPEKGYWVQIDEGNNPVSQQQLGILNIRIGIRPTYPAEYIVVEIGIWDGEVTVEEL